MDKKLKRTIGYIKPGQAIKVAAKKEEVVNLKTDVIEENQEKEPEIDLVAILKSAELKTKKVVKWINEHEEFKWGVMCTKLGIDRGNFQRTLNSTEPNIKIELVLQIENFLTEYGYAK